MNPLVPVLTVLAWTGILATMAFDGASKQLERACTTHAPTVEACQRF